MITANRSVDARVARALGLDVVHEAWPCWTDEPGLEPEMFYSLLDVQELTNEDMDHPIVREPVYIHTYPSGAHELRVVPHYTTDWRECGPLLEKVVTIPGCYPIVNTWIRPGLPPLWRVETALSPDENEGWHEDLKLAICEAILCLLEIGE
jgi:hypothetical protein